MQSIYNSIKLSWCVLHTSYGHLISCIDVFWKINECIRELYTQTNVGTNHQSLIQLQLQHWALISMSNELFSLIYISANDNSLGFFFPPKLMWVRLNMSTYRGSCQWAFQGYLCILEWVTSAGMLMLKDRGSFSACVCVCSQSSLCSCGPSETKVPCLPRESFRVRRLMQKCQQHWKWSRSKCVNGLVWELPLCQNQLVRMRSRESALINYLHKLD